MKTFIISLIVSFVSLYLTVAFVSFDICFIAKVDGVARFALLFFTLMFGDKGKLV